MKFSCQSSKLQRCIGIVEKAISSRTSLPILENILFELKGNNLVLRGNDLEIGIEYSMPIEGQHSDGKFLVKAKTISSIVSKLQNQKVDFDVSADHKVVIRAGRVDYNILGLGVEEYPVFPSMESGLKVTLKASELKELIKHTIFAVSFDETKQFLNGILVKSEQETLSFVSTDGYRLSLKNQVVEQPDQDFSVIVPYKAMHELYKIISQAENDDLVRLNVSPNQVAFSMDHLLFISRVIQGQFPDYRQVIPKESQHAFSVSKRLFLDASERASIIASASNNVVRLSFENDKLSIRANAASMGQFEEQLDVSRVKGDGEAKIAFNVRLILDSIRNLDMDELRVEFNNELSPCVIKPISNEDYTYIIMPVRTSDYQEEPVKA